jgi:hypothetical protein
MSHNLAAVLELIQSRGLIGRLRNAKSGGLPLLHLLIRVQYSGGIDEGGTCIDSRRNGERFRDFFPRGSVTCRGFGVNRDTAVTPDSDRDRERSRIFGPSRLAFWPAALSV